MLHRCRHISAAVRLTSRGIETSAIGSQNHDMMSAAAGQVRIDAEFVSVARPSPMVLALVARRTEQPGSQKLEIRSLHRYGGWSQNSRVTDYRAGKFLRRLRFFAGVIDIEAGWVVRAPVIERVLFYKLQLSRSNFVSSARATKRPSSRRRAGDYSAVGLLRYRDG